MTILEYMVMAIIVMTTLEYIAVAIIAGLLLGIIYNAIYGNYGRRNE